MTDWVEILLSFGGGASILCLVLFMVYRNLVKQLRDDRRYMEDRLTEIIDNYNEVAKEGNQVMLEHTKVLSELKTWLMAKNGK